MWTIDDVDDWDADDDGDAQFTDIVANEAYYITPRAATKDRERGQGVPSKPD